MFTLTLEDEAVLASLARKCSRDGEEAETMKTLVDGFSLYSEEALLKSEKIYVSRKEFFKARYGSLLENIGFAGQTFEQVFASDNGRNWLCQLVRSTGVLNPDDMEDIVQEISRKFWQARWVERYNPLISPWRYFLLKPIHNYVTTYKLRKSKRVTTGALSLDREDERDGCRGVTVASRLYDLSADDFPGNCLIVREFMEDWENYLRSREPIRTVVRRDFKKMCTLLSPGIPPDISISSEEEKDIFFLQGGHYNSRVTTRELYNNGITLVVPNERLVDYITVDPVDNVPFVDELTGEFVTQKCFPNPDYDPSVVIKEQRTWMDFYNLVMQGLQIDEIARELRMASPSIPARIHKLESLFRDFWLVSKKIPWERRIQAAKTYQCPGCGRLDRVKREECCVCGTDMWGEVAEVRFNAYPWPKVYASRKTYKRLGNRRQALVVQRCSLSV